MSSNCVIKSFYTDCLHYLFSNLYFIRRKCQTAQGKVEDISLRYGVFVYLFFVNLFSKFPKFKMMDYIKDKKYNLLTFTLLTTYRNNKKVDVFNFKGKGNII